MFVTGYRVSSLQRGRLGMYVIHGGQTLLLSGAVTPKKYQSVLTGIHGDASNCLCSHVRYRVSSIVTSTREAGDVIHGGQTLPLSGAVTPLKYQSVLTGIQGDASNCLCSHVCYRVSSIVTSTREAGDVIHGGQTLPLSGAVTPSITVCIDGDTWGCFSLFV